MTSGVKAPAISFPLAAAARAFASRSIFRCGTKLFRDLRLGYCCSDELFDGVEFILFFFADKGISHPICLGPGRTADAVYIVFPVIGHVVVDHQIDAVDVDAAAKDICSYQDLETSAAELE